MKRTIITLFAILALATAGSMVAQSSTTGTAPAGTALNDPGQQSNNLNKPENVNPSPANTNGMTTGAKPYNQPTGTAPTTTMATPPSTMDQTTTSGSTATSTTTDTTTGTSYGTTGTTGTTGMTGMSDNTTRMGRHHKSGRLPRTASELPLLAGLGFLALSTGFLVRKRSQA